MSKVQFRSGSLQLTAQTGFSNVHFVNERGKRDGRMWASMPSFDPFTLETEGAHAGDSLSILFHLFGHRSSLRVFRVSSANLVSLVWLSEGRTKQPALKFFKVTSATTPCVIGIVHRDDNNEARDSRKFRCSRRTVLHSTLRRHLATFLFSTGFNPLAKEIFD